MRFNCMMYQFFSSLSEKISLQETYAQINRIFWGNYFHLVGDEAAQNLSETYEMSAVDAAKRFALEFWRLEEGKFPETIALGYEFPLDENE